MRFETIAVHAGMHIDAETGAIAPPIHLSTTFERNAEGDTPRGFGYIRESNPTGAQLEEALAAIDTAAAALAFSSGMAAGAALLQALPAGSHVLLPDDSYYAFRALAAEFAGHWGLTFDTVAMDDLDAVRTAMRENTRLVVVDGTFATPALQRPIELGADVVLHSTTKYLGGHTDVQGGSLAFALRDALYERTAHVRTLVGGVASPFNSWLVMRGIRSLAARMRVHSENAMAVATFLAAHPRVETVFYPGLGKHRGHEIAARQMSAFGGMLSFLVKGGRADALRMASRTRLFIRATSLGGVESLIEHRASSEGDRSTTPQNLLRLSVGLEHRDDLVTDLRTALE